MSPDEDHITVQRYVSDVVAAVMAAHRCCNRAQVAIDIVGAAALVAGDDAEAKSAVAYVMMQMAQKLDRDVINATALQ